MLNHNPALDGVRGLAITLVLVCHSSGFGPQVSDAINQAYHRIAHLGWAGVDLFFVLSGFLISSILLDARARPGYFTNFYMRRILRIFPAYFTFLGLLFLVICLLQPEDADLGWLEQHQLWFWAYLQNWKTLLYGEWLPGHEWNGHTWSLAIEEQFYMLWPLVVLLCAPRQLMLLCLVLILGTPLLRYWLLAGGINPQVVYMLTPARLDALAGGALLAAALQVLYRAAQSVSSFRSAACACSA